MDTLFAFQERLSHDLESRRAELTSAEAELQQTSDLLRHVAVAQQQKQQQQKEVLVDVGQRIFAPATLDDPSRMLVRVGLGFYLELTHAETADGVLTARIALLRGRRDAAVRALADVASTLAAVTAGIEQLRRTVVE